MDSKLATVIGAVGTLACAGAAQAMTTAMPAPAGGAAVQSYSDLLKPVPNATEVLAEMNSADEMATPPRLEKVQWHHHHHHHHQWVQRYRVVPQYRVIPPRYYYHHHHHHHHHHQYRRDW